MTILGILGAFVLSVGIWIVVARAPLSENRRIHVSQIPTGPLLFASSIAAVIDIIVIVVVIVVVIDYVLVFVIVHVVVHVVVPQQIFHHRCTSSFAFLAVLATVSPDHSDSSGYNPNTVVESKNGSHRRSIVAGHRPRSVTVFPFAEDQARVLLRRVAFAVAVAVDIAIGFSGIFPSAVMDQNEAWWPFLPRLRMN